ncbi:MAG: polymerase sigma factor, sigma-70 family [Sphingobacteriales bacterium]|nr:polymerase sigma factor, sigma-70 family [Sphingobacteriales bacterium]
MPKTLLNDFELWIDIRSGDELAFSVLFNRYWKRLYKMAFNYLKNEEASEEIVHDVFLNIWTRRNELEIHSFPNFLLSAIKYQIYNRMRSAKLSLVYKADYTNTDNAFELNLGDDRIQQLELQEKLNQCLKQLPKRCHEIFEMSRIENLSNQEIADRLGISKRTIENQIAIAVKHLRVRFKSIASFILLLFFINIFFGVTLYYL